MIIQSQNQHDQLIESESTGPIQILSPRYSNPASNDQPHSTDQGVNVAIQALQTDGSQQGKLPTPMATSSSTTTSMILLVQTDPEPAIQIETSSPAPSPPPPSSGITTTTITTTAMIQITKDNITTTTSPLQVPVSLSTTSYPSLISPIPNISLITPILGSTRANWSAILTTSTSKRTSASIPSVSVLPASTALNTTHFISTASSSSSKTTTTTTTHSTKSHTHKAAISKGDTIVVVNSSPSANQPGAGGGGQPAVPTVTNNVVAAAAAVITSPVLYVILGILSLGGALSLLWCFRSFVKMDTAEGPAMKGLRRLRRLAKHTHTITGRSTLSRFGSERVDVGGSRSSNGNEHVDFKYHCEDGDHIKIDIADDGVDCGGGGNIVQSTTRLTICPPEESVSGNASGCNSGGNSPTDINDRSGLMETFLDRERPEGTTTTGGSGLSGNGTCCSHQRYPTPPLPVRFGCWHPTAPLSGAIYQQQGHIGRNGLGVDVGGGNCSRGYATIHFGGELSSPVLYDSCGSPVGDSSSVSPFTFEQQQLSPVSLQCCQPGELYYQHDDTVDNHWSSINGIGIYHSPDGKVFYSQSIQQSPCYSYSSVSCQPSSPQSPVFPLLPPPLTAPLFLPQQQQQQYQTYHHHHHHHRHQQQQEQREQQQMIHHRRSHSMSPNYHSYRHRNLGRHTNGGHASGEIVMAPLQRPLSVPLDYVIPLAPSSKSLYASAALALGCENATSLPNSNSNSSNLESLEKEGEEEERRKKDAYEKHVKRWALHSSRVGVGGGFGSIKRGYGIRDDGIGMDSGTDHRFNTSLDRGIVVPALVMRRSRSFMSIPRMAGASSPVERECDGSLASLDIGECKNSADGNTSRASSSLNGGPRCSVSSSMDVNLPIRVVESNFLL
ncbi:hypothetical protein HDU76_014098 [Blyttiomyces sp. JEL0837]|nr:hypothetical protein HDU76_014098 [Blyttiomyces sp. JEL0837]